MPENWLPHRRKEQLSCPCPSGFEGNRRYVSADAVRRASRSRPLRMPFGTYRNRRLDELPESYIRWAAGVARSRRLREALQAELERRREGAVS